MPVLDGFGLMEKILSHSDIDTLPVIALSSLSLKQEHIDIKKAGFEAYLIKPFNVEELYNELIKHLKYSRKESKNQEVKVEVLSKHVLTLTEKQELIDLLMES